MTDVSGAWWSQASSTFNTVTDGRTLLFRPEKLKGPALATGGATDLEAVCLFREEYAKSGSRKGVRHYTPKGKIVPRGTRHSQDLGYTDIDVDIVCPVPAAFEKQLDRLGDVLLKFRYNIGKLLTDTVKGEELDSTVVFSANPIRLRIQS